MRPLAARADTRLTYDDFVLFPDDVVEPDLLSVAGDQAAIMTDKSVTPGLRRVAVTAPATCYQPTAWPSLRWSDPARYTPFTA